MKPIATLSSAAAVFAAAALLTSLAMAQTPRYTLVDLGPVGPGGQPFGVTNNDLVAGTSIVPDGTMQAILWYKGTALDLGTLGLKGSNSAAFGVNANGQMVGQTETWTSNPDREDFCGFKALGLPAFGSLCRPFVWQNGVMTPLPTLRDASGAQGENGMANQINSKGQAVGISENTSKDPSCPSPQKYQFKPVMWSAGKVQELPTFTGDLNGLAYSINESGQVAGSSGTCVAFNPNALTNLQSLHALLWENGVATDLGNLGGSGHGAGVSASGINNSGQITGVSDLPGDQAFHAFLWSKTTGMRDLGTLSGDVASFGVAINDGAEVTGSSLDANFNIRAFHWQGGVMTDLNSLIPAGSPLYLLLACGINARGEISGLAVTATGVPHAYLLTPVPASGTTANARPAPQGAPVVMTDELRQSIRQTMRLARLPFAVR